MVPASSVESGVTGLFWYDYNKFIIISCERSIRTGPSFLRCPERIITVVRRIQLVLQYDGSSYQGWQIQRSGTTIQGVLQDCIFRITEEPATVVGAGRTDAGVHALKQIAAFDSGSALPLDVMRRALNAVLPEDIRVMDIREVERDFHPRYLARSKRYGYLIANMRDVPVFVRKYTWWVKVPLDLDAMRSASACLVGRHDFSSFRGAGCGARSTVREIHDLVIEQSHEAPFLFTTFPGNYIRVSIEGDAFLRHMVRNITGTLVEVGRGRLSPERVRDILESGDRKSAGPTAPPGGLFLEKITY
jgi:tRNA pseudouridine38-40 synthase